MKDYDDIDIAIVAVFCLGVVAMVVGASTHNLGQLLWGLVQQCVTGIVALARGSKKDEPGPPVS